MQSRLFGGYNGVSQSYGIKSMGRSGEFYSQPVPADTISSVQAVSREYNQERVNWDPVSKRSGEKNMRQRVGRE